ncbi:MAG TPA: AAA family ATPase, partial [Reyranella sp.]|nr:AAA family ATPase [Reyranella sp.]
MRLKSIRVINYKGFSDSEVVELGKNWTVIVGRNNVGKTAFLEAFPFGQFIDKPHRSIEQDPTAPRVPQSQSEISVEIMPSEIRQFFLGAGGSIAIPVQGPEHAKAQA